MLSDKTKEPICHHRNQADFQFVQVRQWVDIVHIQMKVLATHSKNALELRGRGWVQNSTLYNRMATRSKKYTFEFVRGVNDFEKQLLGCSSGYFLFMHERLRQSKGHIKYSQN